MKNNNPYWILAILVILLSNICFGQNKDIWVKIINNPNIDTVYADTKKISDFNIEQKYNKGDKAYVDYMSYDNNNLYFAGSNNDFLCYNLDSNKITYLSKIRNTCNGFKINCSSGFTVCNDTIYVGAFPNKTIYVFDKKRQSLINKFESMPYLGTNIKVYNNTLILVFNQFLFFSFDYYTQKYKVVEPNPTELLMSDPVFAIGDTCLVSGYNLGIFYMISREAKEISYRIIFKDEVIRPLGFTENYYYVLLIDKHYINNIYRINRKDYSIQYVKADFSMLKKPRYIPNTDGRNGILTVSTNDNTMYFSITNKGKIELYEIKIK